MPEDRGPARRHRLVAPRGSIAMSALLAASLPEAGQPPGVVTRPIADGDDTGLGELMFEAFAGTADDDGSLLEDHTDVARRTLAGQFGPLCHGASLVATAVQSCSHLVGAVIVTVGSDLPFLAFALVRPAWQRRGLGAALMAGSAAALHASGHTRWALSVTRHNPAVQLYRRLGFEEDPSLRRHGAGPAPTSEGFWR